MLLGKKLKAVLLAMRLEYVPLEMDSRHVELETGLKVCDAGWP